MDIGYVLHRRRYRETSLIVDFLTRDHGRVGAVARGALRRNSKLGANLQPLVPLAIKLSGRTELLTLAQAEATGAALAIAGERLYCVLYVNELIVRLTAAHDPNRQLFDIYCATLAALASGQPLQSLLRRFEKRLLDTLGLGLNLETAADSGRPLVSEREYKYVVERGPLPHDDDSRGVRVRGSTLLALAHEHELAGADMLQARALMRYVIDHHLDGRPLGSRKLFEAQSERNS